MPLVLIGCLFLIAICVVSLVVISTNTSMSVDATPFSTKFIGEYKIGDIITFLPEGYDRKTIPTTHRIIGINDDGTFKTKGDANNTKDPVDVKKELIVGEVKIDENGQPLSVIRNVGIFVEWVKSGGGLIYIIAFIVILGGGIYLVVKKED
jgi:hypothetical protein